MKNLEKKIASRLQSFVDALKRDDDLTTAFNFRTVVIDIKPGKYAATKIIQTRNSLGASQAVFARFLGVSVKTVRAWEQGINPPNDMACRFMDEIRLNLDYWRARLKSVVKIKKPA